jgi:hypothetical protein
MVMTIRLLRGMTYHRFHSRASAFLNAVLAFFSLAASSIWAEWGLWWAFALGAALGIAFVTACALSILDIRRDIAASTGPERVPALRLALEFLAIPVTGAFFIGEVSAGELFWAAVSGILLVASAAVLGAGLAANTEQRGMD